MTDALTEDALIRAAAFEHVRALQEIHDPLGLELLSAGFIYLGERLPLINQRRGIFKPQRMRYLLSIRTAFPKPGAKAWYDDQREVHRQIDDGDQTVDPTFMGDDPDTAYPRRCALSGRPEPTLLDAAHIIFDANERLGRPVVPTGTPLSRIHRATFDAHLIGIDPDSRVHVAERLRAQQDGPMLKALERLQSTTIHHPPREHHRPGRDRLAKRFEVFRAPA